jgi:hypothetical protein
MFKPLNTFTSVKCSHISNNIIFKFFLDFSFWTIFRITIKALVSYIIRIQYFECVISSYIISKKSHGLSTRIIDLQ